VPRFKDQNSHAFADAARFALPWKRAESNGPVIGFVISFSALMRQATHYQQLGGEGS